MKKWPVALSVWLCVAMCAVAQRMSLNAIKVDAEKDAHVLEHVEAHREKLPEFLKVKNNFATARAEVEGLDKVDYFAHSSISNFEELPFELSEEAIAQLDGISLVREERRFKTYCVNRAAKIDGEDCWERHVDTESKILEDIASRLPSTTVSGRMWLYTDLYPCKSCSRVITEFRQTYPDIHLKVYYKRR